MDLRAVVGRFLRLLRKLLSLALHSAPYRRDAVSVPQLLNNLKVQERQNRVCTTIAIAIVAETCQPFTVLPALMNEYRVPELNVQNGVLKALSFLFEYIGEMAKDYIYAVVPLLEDALMDRDLVHRQTACATVKHMALGASSSRGARVDVLSCGVCVRVLVVVVVVVVASLLWSSSSRRCGRGRSHYRCFIVVVVVVVVVTYLMWCCVRGC
jgi:hypothetical protein